MQTGMVRRRLGVATAALMVAVAACGADQTPLTTQGDDRKSRPGEVELDRDEIEAREQVWLAARPPAYAYEVETECDCSFAGTYDVTVEGDEVLGAESHAPDAELFRTYSPPTINGAFAMLDEPLALAASGEISAGRASAAFDPTFGFPSAFTIIGSDGLPSYHVEIRDFVPIEPAAIDRTAPGLVLLISNQSFDDPDVGLTITVDGAVVVERSFAVEGQHHVVGYRLPLEPGDHEFVIRADTGATEDRLVTLGADRRYLYVGYLGDGPSTPEPFSIKESDQPFGFG